MTTDEDRYIVVKAEIRVTIDRRLVEQTGIPETRIRKYVESRVSSFAHRVSAWLTETIASSLLLAQRPQRGGDVFVVRSEDTIYVIPVSKKWNRKARKYLCHQGRPVPLVLSTRREVVNDEARNVLESLLGDEPFILLRLKRESRTLYIGEDVERCASNS